MSMRNSLLAAAVLLAGPALAQTPAPAPSPAPSPAPVPAAAPTPPGTPTSPGAPAALAAPAPLPADPHTQGLQEALRNYPPLVIATGITATTGGTIPKSCPNAGSRIEQRGGPTMEFVGVSPEDPTLCLMKVGGEPFEAWFGIWGKTWPGAEYARRGLARVMSSRTGDVVGFDVTPAPEAQWHDLIRLEGIEDIKLLGTVYKAMKLSHYREGFNGNTYRSLSTVWKDIDSGLIIYGTYQHISGAPELDGAITPSAIVPAP